MSSQLEDALAKVPAAVDAAIQKYGRIPCTREEWLKRRQGGIGGSDAAAVLGLSSWKSPYALWAEKCGLVEPENLDEVEYVKWGSILEAPIAEAYALETGRQLIDHGRFAIQVNDLHPFMHCTIDREISTNGPFLTAKTPWPQGVTVGMNGILSIKNAGEYKRADWEEEPPLAFQIQLEHELACSGMQWGSFAVLIGGHAFRWCDWPRNDKFIRYLIEREEEFWDRVLRGTPPEADASDSTKEVLLRLYPKDTGETIEMQEVAGTWLDKLTAAREAQKTAQAAEQEAKNWFAAELKTATIGLLTDGRKVSYKQQHRDSYTVAATDFRALREVKGKRGKR